MQQKYLTKSLFKLSLDCETKLYYRTNKEFVDTKVDDPFMEALAEGGYQVEELAKLYHPGGVTVDERGHDKSIAITNELLLREKVVIYQAAFRFKQLFIRADIIVKNGKSIDLIEVKAKSTSAGSAEGFLNKKGILSNDWKPYVYDVAFQKYVLSQAFPEFKINTYLMLADKNARTSVDGLNQKFLIKKDENGYPIAGIKHAESEIDYGDKILIKIQIDDLINRIYEGTDSSEAPGQGFIERINWLSKQLQKNERIETALGKHCASCEFKCNPADLPPEKKSGFHECWEKMAGFSDSDFMKPLVLGLWDFRKKDLAIVQGKYFLEDLTDEDIGESEPRFSGMTRTDRQKIQVQKAKENDTTMVLLKPELKAEMDTWKYPLHFIDFETTAVAIPFHRNMRPYEGIAFQFSHHTVDAKGNIKHVGQYLNDEKGKFPSFDFLRALKKELDDDEGTIFRYASHENSYLNLIFRQLKETSKKEVPDRDELCQWIKTITTSTDSQTEKWQGNRTMVDMLEIVKRFYYDPHAGGSNSIKKILPAVLNRSQYLKQKYSKPIYGTDIIPSFNFANQIWIEYKDGKVTSPYDLLPPIFADATDEQLEGFISDPTLADGGAAMMAYARMQFSEMTVSEKEMVAKGLLKYCELDTFAMVLIWEFWHNELQVLR